MRFFSLLGLSLLLASGAVPADDQHSWQGGIVARALFTSGVQEREPVDQVSEVPGGTERVYFFTELQDMTGQTVVHRWEYLGETMAELRFEVGGPRWRVWSSKAMLPEQTGAWRVSVLNTRGDPLLRETLYFGP